MLNVTRKQNLENWVETDLRTKWTDNRVDCHLPFSLFSPQNELYIQQQVQVRLKIQTVQNKCQIHPKYKFITLYMLRQQYAMMNEQSAIIEIG